MTLPILGFKKAPYQFLSNMTFAWVDLDEWSYPSVEHAYQAAKTLDTKERKIIFNMKSPYDVKKYSKTLTLRKDWDEVKLKVMEDLLRQKFTKNSEHGQKLLDTGDAHIEETNWWGDTFWGVCKGKGENHLGKLLMKIRGDIA